MKLTQPSVTISLDAGLKDELAMVEAASWAYSRLSDKTTRYARQLAALVDVHTSAAAVYSDALEKAKEEGL